MADEQKEAEKVVDTVAFGRKCDALKAVIEILAPLSVAERNWVQQQTQEHYPRIGRPRGKGKAQTQA